MNPNDEKLSQFLEDGVMYAAVRSIIEQQFDANSLKNVPRSERQTAVQAIFDGRLRIEKAFTEMEKFRQRDATNNNRPII